MSKKVVLISSDREKFVVDKEAAAMSITVRDLMEDIDEGDDIPIPNVQGKILAKVIEFCNKHAKAAPEGEGESSSAESEELKAWDAEFCNVDQGTLFELILAANYLNIKPLLDLTCMTVANMIKGKSPEEIRETFNIENDFTPEEEEEVRRENQWAFE